MRISLSPAIKAHPLFAGSILGTLDRFKTLDHLTLCAYRDVLDLCDDRTPKEESFLALVRSEIKRIDDEIEEMWNFEGR